MECRVNYLPRLNDYLCGRALSDKGDDTFIYSGRIERFS